MSNHKLEIGIVGAGIGGVMASIAIAQAGAKVVILEAANELGEIGAGIQMTPNVARLLQRYGVDKVIGNGLVRFTELNLRQKDGTPIGYTPTRRVEDTLGYPWWLVHRHHLHNGLVEVARQNGVEIIIDSRVASIEQRPDNRIAATTEKGKTYEFDLLVGADGVSSVVRRTLFPDVKPRPPSGNCAYRAVVPWDEVRDDPLTRELVENEDGSRRQTMEVWMAPTGYIISYPIGSAKDLSPTSDEKVFNMVLSHFRDTPVDKVQAVDIEEVRDEYKDYDPRIRRIIEMIKPGISRWPLLVTGPLESWSNSEKNIVLMGDAAHSMTNHMAQGAATSMEDGVFLAHCLAEVVKGQIPLAAAVSVYEQGRMPKASYKQQVSYLNGWLWHLPDGPAQQARDRAMEPEIRGEPLLRSPNLYGDPQTVLTCYGYDVESHVEDAIATWKNSGSAVRDSVTTVVKPQADATANWFLPPGMKYPINPGV